MKDDNGNITYTPPGAIYANIKYNVLDALNPISISPDVSIFFPGTVDYKHIDIHISSGVENEVMGIINNIKIV